MFTLKGAKFPNKQLIKNQNIKVFLFTCIQEEGDKERKRQLDTEKRDRRRQREKNKDR